MSLNFNRASGRQAGRDRPAAMLGLIACPLCAEVTVIYDLAAIVIGHRAGCPRLRRQGGRRG